jgi:hypothetical protein
MFNMKIEPGFTWIPSSELEMRIATIPVPKKLKSRFFTVVYRWAAHSGSEWTVSRLKVFKDCLLASIAANKTMTLKPEWFSTTHSGNLSGVFGSLWRVAMEDTQSLKAVLFLVNIYTGVCRKESTPALMEEIKSSIQQKSVVIPKRGHGKVSISDVYKAFRKLPKRSNATKRCALPLPLTVVLPGKVGHAENLPQDVLELAGSPVYKVWENKLILDAALGAENTVISSKFSTVVGNVGITHEPGLKTRYFAFPNVVIQRALEPLKVSLLRQLQSLPWDCTTDQRRADNVITSALANERIVHSVDMSKATDSFPWEFQLAVGRCLTLMGDTSRSMLDLMDMVVRDGIWKLPDGSRVRWTKGQPLGLGPSFPLFTISHGILLFILNEYKWGEAFYVLGDDVIILDDILAQKYRKVLMDWDIQISETKSFTSSYIAQFAGVTYTRDGKFHLPKWRPFTRDALLDLSAWWYPGLTKGLPDHDLISRVLSLPEPYGLGRNPEGLSLNDRFGPCLVEALLLQENRRLDKAMPCATRVNLSRLADVLGNIPNAYPLLGMLSASQVATTAITLDRSYRRSTDRPLPLSLIPLMDGTEVAGYPYLRRKPGKVDPYTLGTLKAWKQVFRVAEKLKSSE